MPKIDEEHTDIVWARIDWIVTQILGNERYMQSKRSKEIVELIREKYGASERTAQRYLALAKREVRRIGKEQKEKAFVKAIRDREYLLAKAKKDDPKLALEIMKDRDKLNGLYVENVNHSGELVTKNIDLSKFTERGLERIKRGDPIEEVLIDPEALKND